MLDMVMAILHSNSEVMNAQPKGVVHVFTDDELRTAGEEILLLIQKLNKDGKPQSEADSKYYFAREMLFTLRSCHAITPEVYLHWLQKLIDDEDAERH